MYEEELGRVVGSRIYSGEKTESEDIITELLGKGVERILDGDIYISTTGNKPILAFNAENEKFEPIVDLGNEDVDEFIDSMRKTIEFTGQFNPNENSKFIRINYGSTDDKTNNAPYDFTLTLFEPDDETLIDFNFTNWYNYVDGYYYLHLDGNLDCIQLLVEGDLSVGGRLTVGNYSAFNGSVEFNDTVDFTHTVNFNGADITCDGARLRYSELSIPYENGGYYIDRDLSSNGKIMMSRSSEHTNKLQGNLILFEAIGFADTYFPDNNTHRTYYKALFPSENYGWGMGLMWSPDMGGIDANTWSKKDIYSILIGDSGLTFDFKTNGSYEFSNKICVGPDLAEFKGMSLYIKENENADEVLVLGYDVGSGGQCSIWTSKPIEIGGLTITNLEFNGEVKAFITDDYCFDISLNNESILTIVPYNGNERDLYIDLHRRIKIKDAFNNEVYLNDDVDRAVLGVYADANRWRPVNFIYHNNIGVDEYCTVLFGVDGEYHNNLYLAAPMISLRDPNQNTLVEFSRVNDGTTTLIGTTEGDILWDLNGLTCIRFGEDLDPGGINIETYGIGVHHITAMDFGSDGNSDYKELDRLQIDSVLSYSSDPRELRTGSKEDYNLVRTKDILPTIDDYITEDEQGNLSSTIGKLRQLFNLAYISGIKKDDKLLKVISVSITNNDNFEYYVSEFGIGKDNAQPYLNSGLTYHIKVENNAITILTKESDVFVGNNIMSRVEIDSESDPDYVELTFPKGILPMNVTLNTNSISIYGQYENSALIEYGGHRCGFLNYNERCVWFIEKSVYEGSDDYSLLNLSYAYYDGDPEDLSYMPNFNPQTAGTKLYKHHIQFETEDYIELFNNTEEPIINGTFNANNVDTLQTAFRNAVSIYYAFPNSGSAGTECRPMFIKIDFLSVSSKAKIQVASCNANLTNPQLIVDTEEVAEAFDTVTEL